MDERWVDLPAQSLLYTYCTYTTGRYPARLCLGKVRARSALYTLCTAEAPLMRTRMSTGIVPKALPCATFHLQASMSLARLSFTAMSFPILVSLQAGPGPPWSPDLSGVPLAHQNHSHGHEEGRPQTRLPATRHTTPRHRQPQPHTFPKDVESLDVLTAMTSDCPPKLVTKSYWAATKVQVSTPPKRQLLC